VRAPRLKYVKNVLKINTQILEKKQTYAINM